jgi:predicted dehydrogenase
VVRYAQVGLGVRSWLYSFAIAGPYRAGAELVALCDTNEGRLRQRAEWARGQGFAPDALPARDIDLLLAATRPDRVIVTTIDRAHDDVVVRALRAGCEVICEKPLAIDAGGVQRILDATAETGRRCLVTFNYRYAPPRAQVKELLASGAIGEITSVDFHWLLDTTHGADYFRRWHRRKEWSGGLLVHKASHHFDLVSWWLGDVPDRVYAQGRRAYYVPAQAERLGLAHRSERCTGCAEAKRCPFYLDLAGTPYLRALYQDHERHDGYFRDRCVFSEEIDIEDQAQLVVGYARGARLSYSLHAAMPYEGYTVSFNGTKGRLEHVCEETVYVSGDGGTPGALRPDATRITLFPHFGAREEIAVRQSEGGHGGGDLALLEHLFGPDDAPDPFGRRADHRAGAWAALTGIAANRSIATGDAVRPGDLVKGLA